MRVSAVYQTTAEGFAGDDFLNCVVECEGDQPIEKVQAIIKQIELDNGRLRTDEKFSARTLDIDLLLYGNERYASGGLIIPRDEIVKYAFVLRPLAELAPQFVHPELKLPMQSLWDAFSPKPAMTEVQLTW